MFFRFAWLYLKELDPTAVQDDLSAESFIHLGNEVITTIFVPTNKEIPSSVLAADNNTDDDELQPGDIDFDIEDPTRPSWDELEGALDTIQNAFLFSSQHGLVVALR